MGSNMKLLVEGLNLSEEEKNILESPPDIIKMTIDYLISFSNKPRKTPPKIQNAWIIFLKNFGEYLRKTYPDETFSMIEISREAADVWNNLEDTDLTKIYFKILAKIAKENWKFNFLENYDNNCVQTSPPPFLLESFVHSSSSSISAEVVTFDPLEDEPLINNGDDNITNGSTTIIPQANLIDSIHCEQSANNGNFGIATEPFYYGTSSPIVTDIDMAGPLDDDDIPRYWSDQTFDSFKF
ncbi:1042_t:CDS:1 [Entrophospora sp. SA101]|nr:7610_t:CDS:1 [Entrophospora sp. SA101]CAJ0909173.1 1042_t:CDS:1 [Entrophospora sp. SA101]